MRSVAKFNVHGCVCKWAESPNMLATPCTCNCIWALAVLRSSQLNLIFLENYTKHVIEYCSATEYRSIERGWGGRIIDMRFSGFFSQIFDMFDPIFIVFSYLALSRRLFARIKSFLRNARQVKVQHNIVAIITKLPFNKFPESVSVVLFFLALIKFLRLISKLTMTL